MSGIIGHQKVFKLDISVDDETRVQSFYTLRHLSDNHLGMLFVERLGRLLAHIVQKVASWHVFYHDIVKFIILKAFNERKHLGAVVAGEFLHDFNLLKILVVPVEVMHYLSFFDAL